MNAHPTDEAKSDETLPGIREIMAAADKAAKIELQQPTDMDKLMSTGARLLKSKMDEHLALTSSYERQRIELVDSYRVRIERLRIEAEDQLRSLESAHALQIQAIERLITKLKALREA